MNTEALAGTLASQRPSMSAEQIDRGRRAKEDMPEQYSTPEKSIQPEELLSQIKALTEDGLYSVRFENDRDLGGLVVKVVDRDSGETVREIPPEELRELSKHLNELRGNLVDTVG
ncbi:MAG: flagellar protein FlaG [Desulfofustis sp.]|nr:flagellar protein FlaG [Desulfofustis sp.]